MPFLARRLAVALTLSTMLVIGGIGPIEALGQGHRLRLEDPSGRLVADFTLHGAEVRARGDEEPRLTMRLLEWGRVRPEMAFVTPPTRRRGRIEYAYGGITEWWKTDRRGIQQGWVVKNRPERDEDEPLALELQVGGMIAEPGAPGRAVQLTDGDRTWTYSGLRAWDRNNRELEASMFGLGDRIRIEVDDAEAVYPVTIDPFVQTKKIVATGAQPEEGGAQFGGAVAFDDDTAVIGAPFDDIPEGDGGLVYFFDKDEGGTDNWGLVDYESNSGGEAGGYNPAGDYFGEAVAADSGLIVAGARGRDRGSFSDAGAVYIFERTGGSDYSIVDRVMPATGQATSYFGAHGLDVQGPTAATAGCNGQGLIVVGAPTWDESGIGSSSGAIFLFLQNEGGNDNWGQSSHGRLPVPGLAAGDYLGISAAIDGTTLVTGSQQTDNGGTGKVHVHYCSEGGDNNWGHRKTFTGSDSAGDDQFGSAVAIDEDTLVVGAPGDDSKKGSAYVFQRNEGGNDNWGQVQKLVASDGAAGDHFGRKLVLDGSRLLIGTNSDGKNGAYLFEYSGGSWTETQILVADDAAAGDRFGQRVALSGARAIVGAAFKNGKAGAAYIFDFNNSPVANDDSYNGVVSGGTLDVAAGSGVLDNDTDADGDALTAAKVTDPANGTLDAFNADGSFSYTADAGFVGDDTFTYKANDGTSDSGNATVTITVASPNVAPVANDDGYSVDEDDTLNVSASGVLDNDTDSNGDALDAVKLSDPSNGTLTLNADGSFSYTPNANFNGSDSFTYKANDGSLDSGSATVTITVDAVNDPPVANDDAYSTDEDTELAIKAPGLLDNDSDPDGDGFKIVSNTDPANGTVSVDSGGSFTYTPNADFNGTDSFTYTISDGTATSDPATVTITVNGDNDPPVATDDAYSTDEDTALSVKADGPLGNDSDPDGDALTAVKVSDPSDGSLTLNSDGSFTYTPNADFNGSDSFTYKANDGSADSNTATVTITVDAVNDAPVASNDDYSTDENTELAIKAPGLLDNDSDADDDDLTAVKASDPSDGTLTLNSDGSFTYTPNADFTGTDSFTYKANDGSLDSGTATVTITVDADNNAPVASDDAYSVVATGRTLAVSAPGVLDNDTDGDGGSLSAVKMSDPANGTLASFNADGSFEYQPANGFTGTDSFTYVANDGSTDSKEATVTITVEACQVNVSPPSLELTADGGTEPVTVTTQDGCSWEATVDAAFRVTVSPNPGTGSRTVELTVGANTGEERSASVAFAALGASGNGQTVTLTQEAGCFLTIDPSRRSVKPRGGTTQFEIGTRNGCGWTVASPVDWAVPEVTSGDSSRTVRVEVARNNGPDRTTALEITVNGLQSQRFEISQNGLNCAYSLSSTESEVRRKRGRFEIGVETDNACAWTAESDSRWASVSPASSQGNGTVTVEYGRNGKASARAARLTIAGIEHTLVQSAGCVYSLSPESISVSGDPIDGESRAPDVRVTTNFGDCSWTLVSDEPWITPTGHIGSGSRTIHWLNEFVRVDGNAGESSRSGVIALVDHGSETKERVATLEIEQAGSDCTPRRLISDLRFKSSGGSRNTAFFLPRACEVNPTPFVPWLSARVTSRSRRHVWVQIEALGNSEPKKRVGELTLAGQTLTVTQPPGECTVKISPEGEQVLNADRQVLEFAITVPRNCKADIVSVENSWLSLMQNSVGSFGGGNTIIGVEPNTDPEDRIAQIVLAGQPVTIRQLGNASPLPRAPILSWWRSRCGYRCYNGRFLFKWQDRADDEEGYLLEETLRWSKSPDISVSVHELPPDTTQLRLRRKFGKVRCGRRSCWIYESANYCFRLYVRGKNGLSPALDSEGNIVGAMCR